ASRVILAWSESLPRLAAISWAPTLPWAGLLVGERVAPAVGVVPGLGVGVTTFVGVGVGGCVGFGVGVAVLPTGLVGVTKGVKLTGVGTPPKPLFCVGVGVRPGCGVPGMGVGGMPCLPNGPAASAIGSSTMR